MGDWRDEEIARRERDMPFIRRALDRAGLVLAEREGRSDVS